MGHDDISVVFSDKINSVVKVGERIGSPLRGVLQVGCEFKAVIVFGSEQSG